MFGCMPTVGARRVAADEPEDAFLATCSLEIKELLEQSLDWTFDVIALEKLTEFR